MQPKSEPWLQNLENKRAPAAKENQNGPKPNKCYLVGLVFHSWDFYGSSVCIYIFCPND